MIMFIRFCARADSGTYLEMREREMAKAAKKAGKKAPAKKTAKKAAKKKAR